MLELIRRIWRRLRAPLPAWFTFILALLLIAIQLTLYFVPSKADKELQAARDQAKATFRYLETAKKADTLVRQGNFRDAAVLLRQSIKDARAHDILPLAEGRFAIPSPGEMELFALQDKLPPDLADPEFARNFAASYPEYAKSKLSKGMLEWIAATSTSTAPFKAASLPAPAGTSQTAP